SGSEIHRFLVPIETEPATEGSWSVRPRVIPLPWSVIRLDAAPEFGGTVAAVPLYLVRTSEKVATSTPAKDKRTIGATHRNGERRGRSAVAGAGAPPLSGGSLACGVITVANWFTGVAGSGLTVVAAAATGTVGSGLTVVVAACAGV